MMNLIGFIWVCYIVKIIFFGVGEAPADKDYDSYL